ncbi:MAG: LTA synthase family protein [Ruminiclostridium sp.]
MKISQFDEIKRKIFNLKDNLNKNILNKISHILSGKVTSENVNSIWLQINIYRVLFFFCLVIIYMELVFKISVFNELFNIGFVYMLLFSIPIGLILYTLSTCCDKKINRIIAIIITIGLTLIYIVQVVYYQVFTTFFALFSINGAGQALQFWYEILIAISKKAVTIIFLLLPLSFLIIFGKKIMPLEKTKLSFKVILVGIAVFFQLMTTTLITLSNYGELSTHFLYSGSIIPNLSVNRFGLLTNTRLDVKHLVFGFNATKDDTTAFVEDAAVADESDNSINNSFNNNAQSESQGSISDPAKDAAGTAQTTAALIPQVTNTMDIDFDKLIANEQDKNISAMHKYFKSLEPTKKNKYTGMFKNKNLILITAEGFSPYAVNKDLTPTLYKMSQEGFQFTKFYTPIWGVSTSDGEYVACNSLLPKSGVWSFFKSGKNYMPFCMGNQLKKIGYGTRAYHDHTYTYYNRNISHPNMGYIYKGVGNGLDMKKTWPESDLEMIEKTTDEYIGNTPFHTYYMTVSGHLRYTFDGNSMASKNKDLVKELPYSNAVKAYLACNIEFDKAMQELTARLEQAGIAQDTVIAISPDHYPYGLTINEISELAGHTVESNFELYKGIFILWSKGMTSVKVDKPCASMDILPTISNLMGIEYDSRLLMGSDIFSDSSPLVVFSNWSWLTDKARYNSKERKLILADGVTSATVDKKYTSNVAKQVNNKFNYSTRILETDYYSKVLK